MDFGIGFQVVHHDSRIEIEVRNSCRFRLQRFAELAHSSDMGRFSVIDTENIRTIADELAAREEAV